MFLLLVVAGLRDGWIGFHIIILFEVAVGLIVELCCLKILLDFDSIVEGLFCWCEIQVAADIPVQFGLFMDHLIPEGLLADFCDFRLHHLVDEKIETKSFGHSVLTKYRGINCLLNVVSIEVGSSPLSIHDCLN